MSVPLGEKLPVGPNPSSGIRVAQARAEKAQAPSNIGVLLPLFNYTSPSPRLGSVRSS